MLGNGERNRSGAVSERHHHPSDLIGSVIFGLNDGIVTTLVFVLAVAQATGNVNQSIVHAGLAEMLAGGVSMFLGGFIAARATHEAYQFQAEVELNEIRYEPDEERAEVTRMYEDKGFSGPLLDDIVHHVTSDPNRWHRVMVRDELGTPPEEGSSSWQVGLTVGLSFMAGALVPLLPFVVQVGSARALAIALSIVLLAVTGALRSRYSRKAWWISAVEMVGICLAGSAAGLLIGAGLAAVGQ